jgi:putative transposase
MDRLDKNESIRKAVKETRERRTSQDCRVFKIKIDESRLSKRQAEALKMLFVEAKWLYNDILNWSEDNEISTYDTSVKKIKVLNKDKEFEEKELRFIGSQMKQSIVAKIQSAIKGLGTLKRNSHKVGRLKYKSDYTELNMKCYGNVYKFHGNKKVKIAKVPGKVIVNGLDQFINDPAIEFANAKLLNTPLGYYIAVTTYKIPSNEPKVYLPEIGIDMGIKTHITTSEGQKYQVSVGETERLKRLQKQEARRKKGSSNKYKTRCLINKEYQKLSNRKEDLANKIVAELLQHETIYMQDENLQGWKKFNFGKQIHHSILGRVKAKLMQSSRVEVLDQWAPTTKLCICGHKKDNLTLADRIYHCDVCGYEEDRDIHAAKNMIRMVKIIKERINMVPMGHRDPASNSEKRSTCLTLEKPVETINLVCEAGRLHTSVCN